MVEVGGDGGFGGIWGGLWEYTVSEIDKRRVPKNAENLNLVVEHIEARRSTRGGIQQRREKKQLRVLTMPWQDAVSMANRQAGGA